MNMRRVLRVLLTSVLALIAVFVVSNTVDRPLNPAIEPLLARMQVPVSEQDNGYFYLLGMQSGVDDGLYEKGLALQREYEQHRADKPLSYFDHDVSGPAWAQPPGFLCKPDDGVNCLATYRDGAVRRALDTLLLGVGDYLKRYATLLTYPHFQVPLDFYPADSRIRAYHRLFLADVARNWLDGRRGQALARLRDAQRFWRMARLSTGEMTFEFMTQKILAMNLHLLGEMLADCTDCGGHQAVLNEMLTPFTPAELSMSEVILKEFANVTVQVRRADAAGSVATVFHDKEAALLSKMLLINSLQNGAYELYSQGAHYFGMSEKELIEHIGEWNDFYLEYWSPTLSDYFFNFAVTRLHERAIPSRAFEDLYDGGMKLEALRAQLAGRYTNDGSERL